MPPAKTSTRKSGTARRAVSRKRETKTKHTKKSNENNHLNICFVIMPFGGWLDDYYDSIYRPAIKSANLEAHRADDLYRPSTIVNDIWAYTRQATLLLADLTGRNPNVFYELGLAHALGKPAILIAESMEDVPFDLRALRVIIYDKNAPDWGSILKEKILGSILEVLKSPVAAVLPAFLEPKSSPAKPALTERELQLVELRQEIELLKRELRLSSEKAQKSNNRRDIEPFEARRMIRELLHAGVGTEEIIDQMEPLGPPRGWLEEQIERMRSQLFPRVAKAMHVPRAKPAAKPAPKPTKRSAASPPMPRTPAYPHATQISNSAQSRSINA